MPLASGLEVDRKEAHFGLRRDEDFFVCREEHPSRGVENHRAHDGASRSARIRSAGSSPSNVSMIFSR